MVESFVRSFHEVAKIYDKHQENNSLDANHLMLVVDWLEKYYPLKWRTWRGDLELYGGSGLICYKTTLDKKVDFVFGEKKLADCARSIVEKLSAENSLPNILSDEGFREIMTNRRFNLKLRDTAINIMEIYYDILEEEGMVLKRSKKTEYIKEVIKIADEKLSNIKEIPECIVGLNAFKNIIDKKHFKEKVPFRPENFIFFKIISEANGYRFRELDSAIRNLKEINKIDIAISRSMEFGF